MKVRKSSRAILLNSENQIFLFKFEFEMLSGHKILWITPDLQHRCNTQFSFKKVLTLSAGACYYIQAVEQINRLLCTGNHL